MSNKSSQPFTELGLKLKKLRESHAKSQAEVSGAVEIDQSKLQEYETGKIRPSQDILQLIIQHFDLKGHDAKELWKLAGYDELTDDDQYLSNEEEGLITKTVMVTQYDARIVYTDMVQVAVNDFGVIINFLQGAGPSNQPLAVSRIGMSKEHAKSVLNVLQKTLEQADANHSNSRKQLPSSTQD
jgi:transcriptional regulator with XRE-family HTH domain